MNRTLMTLAAAAAFTLGTSVAYAQFVPSNNPTSQQGSMGRAAQRGQYGARDGSKAQPRPQDGTGRGAKSGERKGNGDCTTCTNPQSGNRSQNGSAGRGGSRGGRGGRS